jgi:beta-lactamase class A
VPLLVKLFRVVGLGPQASEIPGLQSGKSLSLARRLGRKYNDPGRIHGIGESKQQMDRREFTKIIGACGGLLASGPWAALAKTGTGSYDISYLWHSDLEAALDYMEQVGQVLGPDVRRRLKIVRGGTGNYGVIYDCDVGSASAAEATARQHSSALSESGLEAAGAIEDIGYRELYNIVYGKGPNLDAHKQNFETVSRYLGPNVKKRLVIEQTPDEEYALVYKRYGERDSTLEVVRKHERSLKGTGISVSLIRENNNDVVYGESSFLHEAFEVKAPPVERTAPIMTDLEQEIEDCISGLRKEGVISWDEQTSWSVYDFTSSTKLVTINENTPRQAASMMKPFVALAFFHRAREGSLIYGPKSEALMRRMIQRSDNAATNRLLDILQGPATVQRILSQNYAGIFRETKIVEKIPMGGRTYRNEASAHDYSRFLYALWSGSLPYSRELRRLMALPNRDRLYDGVPNIPIGTLVYHKTGTTARLCGDFGILVPKDRDGKRYPYTVVAIVEKASRTRSLSRWINSRGNLIRKVSGMVYEVLKAKHDLA